MDIFGASGLLALAIPFIVGKVKQISFIGNRNAPLVAFGLGIVGGIIGYVSGIIPADISLMQAILSGIAIGGTSTGLYDVVKKTIINR